MSWKASHQRQDSVHRSQTFSGVTTSVATAVIILALAVALLLLKPPDGMVDKSQARGVKAQAVSQLSTSSYCPGRMALADTGGIGEAKASEGNIASSVQYSAFGSVYSSSVSTLGGKDQLQLRDPDSSDDSHVQLAHSSADQGASLQTTRLLKAEKGSGSASSVISWASEGDLSGVQATSCLTAGFEHSFFLPSTQQGWSQQLVVYNPSAKATSVTITAYGSSQAGLLPLATHGQLALKAGDQGVFNLAAALPNQDALLVTVTSQDTQISAFVRASVMTGTDPKGSDFVSPAFQERKRVFMPGIEDNDHVRLLVMSRKASDARVSWMSKSGAQQVTRAQLEADKVTTIDLGKAGPGVGAVSLDASEPVTAAAYVSQDSHGGQSDFTIINAASPVTNSAIAVPEHAQGTLALANQSYKSTSVKVRGFNDKGAVVFEKQQQLASQQAQNLDLDSLGHGVRLLAVDDPERVVVSNLRVRVQQVQEAGLAGVANLGAQSLLPKKILVSAHEDQSVLR